LLLYILSITIRAVLAILYYHLNPAGVEWWCYICGTGADGGGYGCGVGETGAGDGRGGGGGCSHQEEPSFVIPPLGIGVTVDSMQDLRSCVYN